MPTLGTVSDRQDPGPCTDCGSVVEQRVEYVDGFTHSVADLCPSCWIAYQQRQVFAGGCCG